MELFRDIKTWFVNASGNTLLRTFTTLSNAQNEPLTTSNGSDNSTALDVVVKDVWTTITVLYPSSKVEVYEYRDELDNILYSIRTTYTTNAKKEILLIERF